MPGAVCSRQQCCESCVQRDVRLGWICRTRIAKDMACGPAFQLLRWSPLEPTCLCVMAPIMLAEAISRVAQRTGDDPNGE